MKTAKIFKHGNSQAVRLPKEFRFADDEVLIQRSGGGRRCARLRRDQGAFAVGRKDDRAV